MAAADTRLGVGYEKEGRKRAFREAAVAVNSAAGGDDAGAEAVDVRTESRRWYDVAGAWLAIGTSPGALLLGAVMARRHAQGIPLASLLSGAILMALLLWFQAQLALRQGQQDGGKLTVIAPQYFSSAMQRLLGLVIAVGMLGWFGFNVGLGASALEALTVLPQWSASLLIGIPVLLLMLLGMKRWNLLAWVTTASVVGLTLLIISQLGLSIFPVTLELDSVRLLVMDVALLVGYVSVFTVRSPDFTEGLKSRADLALAIALLVGSVILVALAGAALQQATATADLIGFLAQSDTLAVGNALIFLAVIAPTFTTLYSGAPALRAAFGLNERRGMVALTAVGLILAITRFDQRLGSWLSLLAALLPPLLIPLALEGALRRRGYAPRMVPLWTWLPASLLATGLALWGQPLAPLAGLVGALITTAIWAVGFRSEKGGRGESTEKASSKEN